ncbi:MAG: DUF975 family protein [Clostridia bacterium]|nr:DUF975 family protein [Clostridia bacterium]
MNVLNRPSIKSESRSFISVDKRWLLILWASLTPTFVQQVIGIFIFPLLYLPMMPMTIFMDGSDLYFIITIIVYSLLVILMIMAIIPFTVAVSGYMLKCLRNNEFYSESIFHIVKPNFWNFISTEIIKSLFLLLWTMLLIIPGYIKAFAYSMTEYIICDNPSLSSKEAINLSSTITKGYKWDLFVMYLSFIPWYLLSIITLGFGYIYVIPYVRITEAMYYENLKKNAIETGIATPEDFGINE